MSCFFYMSLDSEALSMRASIGTVIGTAKDGMATRTWTGLRRHDREGRQRARTCELD